MAVVVVVVVVVVVIVAVVAVLLNDGIKQLFLSPIILRPPAPPTSMLDNLQGCQDHVKR